MSDLQPKANICNIERQIFFRIKGQSPNLFWKTENGLILKGFKVEPAFACILVKSLYLVWTSWLIVASAAKMTKKVKIKIKSIFKLLYKYYW